MANPRHWLLLALVAGLVGVCWPGIMAAEKATPVALVCPNDPRSLAELQGLAATPVPATPLPRSYQGIEPVDPKTANAIRAVVARIVLCLDSDDPTRAYADFSDAYLQRLLSPALLATLGTPVVTDPDDETTLILAIEPILTLPDGRVIATVHLDPALIPVEKTYQFVFVRNGDRWLLDDVVDELRFSLPWPNQGFDWTEPIRVSAFRAHPTLTLVPPRRYPSATRTRVD